MSPLPKHGAKEILLGQFVRIARAREFVSR